MAEGDFKALNKKTADDKVLPDKAFDIAKDRKYDGYQRGLVSMVYKLFDKKTSGGTVNNELAEELHKKLLENLIKENYTQLF